MDVNYIMHIVGLMILSNYDSRSMAIAAHRHRCTRSTAIPTHLFL